MTTVESIVRAHSYRIRKLLLSFRSLSPADRDEVYSRVLLKLVERADSFDNRSAVTTWLHRVVVNEVLMLVRKSSYKNEVGGHVEEDLEPLLTGMSPPSPESELGRAQERAQREAVLAALDAQDRALLERFYVDGASVKELAEEIGIGVGGIKTRLFRVREKARARLGDV